MLCSFSSAQRIGMVVRKEDLRTLLPKLSLQRLMTWKVSLVEAAVGGCESRAAAATATAARIWAECQKTCPHFLKKIGKLTAHPGMSEARGGGGRFWSHHYYSPLSPSYVWPPRNILHPQIFRPSDITVILTVLQILNIASIHGKRK